MYLFSNLLLQNKSHAHGILFVYNEPACDQTTASAQLQNPTIQPFVVMTNRRNVIHITIKRMA